MKARIISSIALNDDVDVYTITDEGSPLEYLNEGIVVKILFDEGEVSVLCHDGEIMTVPWNMVFPTGVNYKAEKDG